MSDDFEPAPEAPDQPQPITRPARREKAQPTPAPALPTDYLLGCCLIDEGHTLDKAIAAGLTSTDFADPAQALIFSTLRRLRAAGTPIATDTLVEALGAQLPQAGGLPTILALDQVGTTARAAWAIQQIADDSERRRVHAVAKQIAELTDLSQLPDLLARLQPRSRGTTTHRTPFSFAIPAKNDPSILLGNRYLNRGDGLVVTSSSGMGKSSMSHQMAADWALGKAFHGIPSNGPLRILIVQSEDSDGDIAEVWASLQHVNQYTPAERAQLDQNLRIISERSLRGVNFIRWLKTQADDFRPDLIILNPLQAFIDGDVTDSKDLGAFLREGLNGINAESKFGYLIVHHTTKPATGKDRHERQWHEVMYDMAGGAEIINWARGIISIRALEEAGKFKVVLAKRGRRAGVTREVPQGTGTRLEPVVVFGLQHASGFLPGTDTGLIYWEPYTLPNETAPKKSTGGGRPATHHYNDYRSVFPKKSSNGLPLNELHRVLEQQCPIKKDALFRALKRWISEGDVEAVVDAGKSDRYRAAL